MRTIQVCRLLFFVSLIQLILNLNVAYTLPLDGGLVLEGSSCELKLEDGTGTCVRVTHCQPALKSIQTRRISHDFNRCGFVGRIEIVCCPNTTATNDNGSSEEHDKDDDNEKTTTSTTSSNPTSKAEVRGPVLRKSAAVCEELADRIGAKLSFQILGGVDAQLGEFPHMAALGYEGIDDADKIEWQCGGSLISDRYVLTAAHCIVNANNKPPIRIRMGKIDIIGNTDNVSAEDFGIANISVHPQYSRRSKQNDIALVKLNDVVNITEYVNPACLYNKADDPAQGLVITGWGHIRFAGEIHSILQKGYLVPVAVSKCNSSYQETPQKLTIQRNQFCAVSSDGKTDACQGDSGGPLQIQSIHSSSIYSIVGVTSFGRGCGGTYPGIYTRVYSYLDWIEGIVWPN